MAEKLNSFEKFWKELKRRKVFSVVTTYAATAYIIIEVTNNLAVPLHLPDWFAALVLVILIIGLPVVTILAWIFDFTPEGIEKTVSLKESEGKEIIVIPVKRRLRASYVLNAILILAVVILAYPRIFKQDRLEKLRIKGTLSVAVMPFQNMTNDTIWNVWQDGIKDILITSLSNSEELKVRQSESVNSLIEKNGITNYASITPALASIISKKLSANVFIYGSIKQAGGTLRLNVQLMDSEKEEIIQSFQIESLASEENIFQIIDSLSLMVKDFLIISKLGKEVTPEMRHLASTSSPEAYRYFIYGNKAFMKQDYSSCVKFLSQAVTIDSNFTFATLHLAIANGNQGLYEEAKRWCLKAYDKKDQMPIWQKIWISWVHAIYFETPFEEIKYLKQLQEIDDQYSNPYSNLGYCYNVLHQYDKAIPELEKVLEIYNKWDSKPSWIYDYTFLGYAYHKTEQFSKEKRLYRRAEEDFPGDPELIKRQAVLALAEGDTIAANSFIEKYKIIQLEKSSEEADILTGVGSIYSEANFLDKAERYYQDALKAEPENPSRMNPLAWFLIDKERNITRGLDLAEKALEASPDNYSYLDTKGWGLFKQGKYHESLEVLEKCRNLIPVYDHELNLRLEAVKKAVASQKRTDR